MRDVRYIASWDALRSDWQRAELDAYMQAAGAAGVRVLLGFGHSRDPRRRTTCRRCSAFEREFAEFRARYPWVDDYLTWNEANHCSQPTCRNPERAAQYYLALRTHCRGCTDRRRRPARQLEHGRAGSSASRRPPAQAPRSSGACTTTSTPTASARRGTRALLQAVKGDIWFTETGGLVRRDNGSTLEFPESTPHAAKATKCVFKLAALSPRVKRVYFYHWAPAPTTRPTWDSALVDSATRPRPAYDVLLTWLRRARHRALLGADRGALLLARLRRHASEGGISGGGKVIGRTVTVYSLTSDPAGANRDFVDAQKLALSDAGGRAGALAVNFSSLDLGDGRDAAGPGRAARDRRPADHRRDRRRQRP